MRVIIILVYIVTALTLSLCFMNSGQTSAIGTSIYLSIYLSLDPYTATSGTQVYLGTMNIFFEDGYGTVHNGTFTNGSSPSFSYNSYTNIYNVQTT